jgi:cyclase
MKQAPIAKAGLPVVTFSRDIKFHLNGDIVKGSPVPHAHTDGDRFTQFKSANMIHAGDLFFNGFYPFIDVTHCGSLKGLINGVDKVLSLADDKAKIIAGHGPLGDKKQSASCREMLGVAHERPDLSRCLIEIDSRLSAFAEGHGASCQDPPHDLKEKRGNDHEKPYKQNRCM